MYDDITDVPGVRVGQFTNQEAGTGTTVVLFDRATLGSVDVRGGAPATRETDLLNPANMMQEVHGVVLTGGSAFGLETAQGVMRYLEERGIGYNVGVARVPIVPAAAIFDLALGSPLIRPSERDGYQAAEQATTGPIEQGSVGAGTGATFAKSSGKPLKGGLGSASATLPDGTVVGALVIVNALGNVWNPVTHEWYGGPPPSVQPTTTFSNTTIALVATNAAVSKASANRIAQMAHDGLAQVIRPIHTMFDGDAIFVMSVAEENQPRQDEAYQVSLLGAVAADTLARAVLKAVQQATELHGYPSV